MSVTEIESAITQLPPKELAELMAWLQEHHQQVWDKQKYEIHRFATIPRNSVIDLLTLCRN
jgi:hypothetical protein